MNFGYNGKNNNELIKKYAVVDNNIVITFLDDSQKTIPNTLENEKNIVNLMLSQAIERNSSSELNKTKVLKALSAGEILASTGVSFEYLYLYANTSMEDFYLKLFSILMAGTYTMLGFAFNKKVYESLDDKIDELKKYDIYLKLNDTLNEIVQDPYVSLSLDERYKKLNINTLDRYSLEEIKNLEKNLVDLKERYDFFNQPKTLRKKKNN